MEATELGRGGHGDSGGDRVHPDTIGRGVKEMEGNPSPQARVRDAGGRLKRLAETDPGLVGEL